MSKDGNTNDPKPNSKPIGNTDPGKRGRNHEQAVPGQPTPPKKK